MNEEWRALPVLKFGAIGKEVKHLQSLIRTLNDDHSMDDENGYFGHATLKAVKEWQKNHPLVNGWKNVFTAKEHGEVGPNTWCSLYEEKYGRDSN